MSLLWQRIKESPRTITALVIILIVAAAIYAFSGESPRDIPCDKYRNYAITDVPARCVSFFHLNNKGGE